MILKKLLYMLLLCVTTMLHAEWETITFNEHVSKSSLIVVAEFQEEIEKKEIEIGTSQLVSFEVDEIIKGDVNGSILVKGQEFFMCVPQMLFPNTPKIKYLLFLEQEEDDTSYSLVHGERSALVIENGSVGWISDRSKIDLGDSVPTSFQEVREEIEEILKR